MSEEIKKILNNLRYTAKKHTIQVLEDGGKIEHCPQEVATEMRLSTYCANILLDYITNLQQKVEEKNKEIERLKDLCNKYEEEHKTAFKLWTQKIEEMPDYEEKMKLKKEVVRLNNIIEAQKKELEEWKKKYGSQ